MTPGSRTRDVESGPEVIERAAAFVRARATGLAGEYVFCPGGRVSLYASCYAALALHTIGALEVLPAGERAAWCAYLNGWQDARTGWYEGPELAPDEFTRPELDGVYVRMHLAAHVLPVLALLGGRPSHPLGFARPFADPARLREWLEARDWRRAWLEGNNLLFVAQFLLHLRDAEGEAQAARALELYFDWLDGQQDPATGLWGTDRGSGPYEALYGAYHPLLAYHYCRRPVPRPDRIIDTILSLQQPDGSFSHTPGGGACEDVDAVDVLVNLVERTGYGLGNVRRALERIVPHLLRQQAPDGGFVYRWGRSYMQSGVLRTFVPADTADLFSTWFRLHTLALTAQVIDLPGLGGVPWRFNPTCSMGWHDAAGRDSVSGAPHSELRSLISTSVSLVTSPDSRSCTADLRCPNRESLGLRLLRRSARALPPAHALCFLAGLDAALGFRRRPKEPAEPAGSARALLDRLGRERAYLLAGGLEPEFWWTLAYRYFLPHLTAGWRVVHLGCGSGSLSYTLASQGGVDVTATDAGSDRLEAARVRYHHPRLAFVPAPVLAGAAMQPDIVVFTDLLAGRPTWDGWAGCWQAWEGVPVLAQLTASPSSWREAARGVVRRPCPVDLRGLVPEGWSILGVEREGGAIFARLERPSRHGRRSDG